jgi:protein-tyrosine phosphatase
VRLLFVCLGNICRSPTAEGVMRALIERERLGDSIELDSAGTSAEHRGSPPDRRATAVARTRGIALDGHARKVTDEDFEDFDLLLAMDSANMRALIQRAPGAAERAKVRMLREFDPASAAADGRELDVPDPYYGGERGFEDVFDMVQAACEGLLAQIREGTQP